MRILPLLPNFAILLQQHGKVYSLSCSPHNSAYTYISCFNTLCSIYFAQYELSIQVLIGIYIFHFDFFFNNLNLSTDFILLQSLGIFFCNVCTAKKNITVHTVKCIHLLVLLFFPINYRTSNITSILCTYMYNTYLECVFAD